MFSMFIRPEVLKKIREDFPEGATVEVVEFHDQYRDVKARLWKWSNSTISTGMFRQAHGAMSSVWTIPEPCTVLSRTVCPWAASGASTSSAELTDK